MTRRSKFCVRVAFSTKKNIGHVGLVSKEMKTWEVIVSHVALPAVICPDPNSNGSPCLRGMDGPTRSSYLRRPQSLRNAHFFKTRPWRLESDLLSSSNNF